MIHTIELEICDLKKIRNFHHTKVAQLIFL
jgi:hypothetical protein